ncbi:MAG TPA: heavy metal-associated domain-containing protein [Telluria sp.]|nr:heavy metal-associated domain-containing protein [Telluria sp.]
MDTANCIEVTLPIAGLRNSEVAAKVGRALCALSGVRSVTVRMRNSEAVIQATAPAPLLQIIRAIEGAGCMVNTVETTVHIGGMFCIGCASPVEKALATIPGVVHAMASYSARKVHVLSLSPVAQHTLAQAVEGAGFSVDQKAA